MKIGILSMQQVPNFGSVLQSYSLKKILNGMGHEVKFINIESRPEDDQLMKSDKLDFSAECRSTSGISKLSKIDRYVLNRFRIKKLDNKQKEVFTFFLNNNLGVSEKNELFDFCFIGSDEVFNCASDTSWGFTAQLFGDVKNAEKVATYAASCGATSIENLPEAVKKRIREAFQNVSGFSVRDENTKRFVSFLTDDAVEMHLDPVVIGHFDEEIARCDVSEKLPKKYCIVYSYYNRMNNKEEIASIQAFCKKKGLEIVSIGAPQMWIKNHVVLTPFETLAAFKNSEFVITDTFHGTIFSAKYAKKFLTLTRPSNLKKLSALLRHLRIEDHHAKNISEIDTIYALDKNQASINEIIEFERERSMRYIRNVLDN